jgi:hypothetical protein
MTYFFELRLFNRSGENCFSVREYGSEANAIEAFAKQVATAKGFLKVLGEDDTLDTETKKTALRAVADQIQLVCRDDNYISLAVVRNWQT